MALMSLTVCIRWINFINSCLYAFPCNSRSRILNKSFITFWLHIYYFLKLCFANCFQIYENHKFVLKFCSWDQKFDFVVNFKLVHLICVFCYDKWTFAIRSESFPNTFFFSEKKNVFKLNQTCKGSLIFYKTIDFCVLMIE